ncbi:quinolinate synthase NadA [Priestia filamentosa]|uniref:quinolinate synthase NadA n=1 Tax=Priestia filamentosa TaxID=1402861 RepID=UPI0005893487|nr:quinolinate synthase NadA [Priestia filamentosa]RJS66640.1 quinolinate synthase NadA [Priestia filamentosa]
MSILAGFEEKLSIIPQKYKEQDEKELIAIVERVKKNLGDRLFILGHHYQKDEVIQFADVTGDSLALSRVASEQTKADYIVFCGVHFMAETADILTSPHQQVILPDMQAGCSMADMANLQQTEIAWSYLTEKFGNTIVPLTYVNSTAEIKSFVGENDGATLTSSNASKIVQWALGKKERILFLPDQHLGRNTAYELDISLEEMAVWDPIQGKLEYKGDYEDIKIILWKGHCSVHQNFTVKNIEALRTTHSDINILVHPECCYEVVQASDYAGSTSFIIDKINEAEKGSKWAIGTEMNLVKRLIDNNPDKQIMSLNPYMCPCLTMNRIDLPHLAWALESIEDNKPINIIKVPEEVQNGALAAIGRML